MIGSKELVPTLFHDEARRIYLSQVVKLDHFPRSPDDVPNSTHLTPLMLGDLEGEITKTDKDGLERFQYIYGGDITGQYRASKVFVGTKRKPGLDALLFGTFQTYFGPKPLIFYHIHPTHADIHYDQSLFSDGDVCLFKSSPRKGYIFMVGSISGIGALFQTEKSVALPYLRYVQAFLTAIRLHNLHYRDLAKVPDARNNLCLIAHAMQKEGFAYYTYYPLNGDRIQINELQNGLSLKKVCV